MFKQNTQIELVIPCIFGGNICSKNAVCNATVRYPNTTYMLNSSVMTNGLNGDFNITLPDSSIAGEYNAKVVCVDGFFNGTDPFTFDITTTGTELSTASGIIYIIVFVISILLFFASLIVTMRLKWKHGRDEQNNIVSVNDLKWVKLLMGYLSYLILIWIFFLAYGVTKNFLFLDGAARFFYLVYVILISLALPILALTVVVVIVAFVEGKKMKDIIDRGLEFR